MTVVTVRQPFASLIAVGAKTLLDQARPTGYRGRLLIRAGSKRPVEGEEFGGWYWEWDVDHGIISSLTAPSQPAPLGVVVASCELVDCIPVVEWLATADHDAPFPNVGVSSRGDFAMLIRERMGGAVPMSDQLPFGDFAPGRWVWLLDDVRPTTERCPRCWGSGYEEAPARREDGLWAWIPCLTCLPGSECVQGAGVCLPVRMRGGPGLRTPEWGAC